jgi:hypothetical protein
VSKATGHVVSGCAVVSIADHNRTLSATSKRFRDYSAEYFRQVYSRRLARSLELGQQRSVRMVRRLGARPPLPEQRRLRLRFRWLIFPHSGKTLHGYRIAA